jgi:fumarate reductase subunit C
MYPTHVDVSIIVLILVISLEALYLVPESWHLDEDDDVLDILYNVVLILLNAMLLLSKLSHCQFLPNLWS